MVEDETGQEEFQEGINNLYKWAQDWQMEFNVDKCHIMHIGPNNKEFTYKMGDSELSSSNFEKDIGVLVQQNLRPSLQCAKAAKKAYMVLAQISRAVSYRDKDTFLRLFRTYVRPHVEYCVPAWSPWTQGDKDVLENVQKRAIGMVTNFKGKTYEEKTSRTWNDYAGSEAEERRSAAGL